MLTFLIQAQGLSKVFTRGLLSSGPRKVVGFRDVDLAIPQGCLYGLIGESGSGKSSLARVLVGMDSPTRGQVLFEGRDLGTMGPGASRQARRRAQMVYQDPSSALNPRMRVGASIVEALRAARIPKAQWGQEIETLLGYVRLDPGLASRWPHELSGGQRQRIVIARALAPKPTFLALDEPVSSLDVSVQAAIVDLLLELKERLRLTYLLVSHDLDLVSAICDRVAVMKDGLIVEEGPREDLVSRPAHAYTKELRARSLPSLERLSQP